MWGSPPSKYQGPGDPGTPLSVHPCVDADSRPAEACGDVELFIDAIGDTDDTGGEARQAQLHGDAYVANGVHFGEPRCRRPVC